MLMSAGPQGAPGDGGSMIGQILPPILIMFVIFYFLLIRPQKRQQQEREAMLKALKRGDHVWTNSGILGTVREVDEKIVTLAIDKKTEARLRVLRSTVAGVLKGDEEVPAAAEAALAAPAGGRP